MIHIVIVDDHAVVRAGLRQYFSEQPDFCVVAEASQGREALALLRGADQAGMAIDVMLLDIAMPEQSGVDALQAIRARAPSLPVLIFSGFPESQYASLLLRQGASGYLSKDCEPEALLQAIRTVSRGRRYISAAVAEQLADGLAAGGVDAAQAHQQLSERELQVFLRLAAGQTVGQLALALCLSVKTVSTYRSRVMDKMGLASNSELTHYALRHGLIL